MSSYHINDLDHYPKTYSFLPNQERDENGENLMTQSLFIQAPYRRIRHPELTPVILNRDRQERNYDVMSQSLIVPPFRRTRHADLTPASSKDQQNSSYKSHTDVKHRYQPSSSCAAKAPKRAFSMTRLDQLARPRQRYLEEALKLRASKTKENLCFSSVRPTSSMSLIGKQQQQQHHSPTSSNASKLNPSNHFNNTYGDQINNGHNGTILLRQRTSARKQRPISYAGFSHASYTSNHNQTSSPHDLLSASSAPFNRASVKSKLSLGSALHHNSRSRSGLSSTDSTPIGSNHRNLMTSSIDGAMLSSLSKPTPPRKPSHIKHAAAVRKAANKETMDDNRQTDRVKKSESSPRISSQLESSKNTITSNSIMDRENNVKKSVTTPEKIAQLLDEKMSINIEKITIDQETSELLEKENDRLLLSDSDKESTDKTKQLCIGHDDESTNRPNEIDHVSTQTFVINERNDASNDQEHRTSFDGASEPAKQTEQTVDVEVISTANGTNETHNPKRAEDELEKQQLEKEEAKRREIEEDKKRELERKVKERAEKARLEMEEKLRRDEQERNERKKRLQAIMSRTRKNPTAKASTTTNVEINREEPITQTITLPVHTNELQELHSDSSNGVDKSIQQNPDVVEDTIKNNLIKLTKTENLNNTINNGKSELHSYIETETIIENKNIGLLNGFKEKKMSQNSTFVYATQNSNETSTYAPGAN